jgi:hypothetical protein
VRDIELGLCNTYGCPGAGDEHLIRVDLGLLEEVCYQPTVQLLSSKIVESKLNINKQKKCNKCSFIAAFTSIVFNIIRIEI